MTSHIRNLFSDQRQIDRKIEKVIDYAADDEARLATEIEEYEATQNVEACFRKFLDAYQAGVQSGEVTEVGIWVSGFYGSGKSSFTKYLGFALDPRRRVRGQTFLELLQNRLRSADVRGSLATVAKKYPTAVVMLDLGTEQDSDSTANTVTNILYWKVLQRTGYSKEKKLAQLEFTLTQNGLYETFRQAYQNQFGEPWEKIHNDPMFGIARASQILPGVLPREFPDPGAFLRLRFEMSESVRDLAQRMIEVVRRASGCENILFLIDEAGQYVAPRGDLILNLDGLARSFKELGQGRVWIIATGQQTLNEIVERAAYNSAELFKLRDRFPITIELDARDIREITYRRLLTKSSAGEQELKNKFHESGQSLIWHTRLQGVALYKDDPSAEDFARFYPFLPQHFDVLMQLIRSLAGRRKGIGLRSAIRVIQDVLVDTSRILPSGETRLADRPVGALATAADFYKTLRADIQKTLPHVVDAVDAVEQAFPGRALHIQAAQAVAALQLLEDFPRTVENIAALLYPQMGFPSLADETRAALEEIAKTPGIGLIEDPQSGGYQFLSERVEPFRRKRNDYIPSGGEIARIRNEETVKALAAQPKARLEGAKDVPAGVRMGAHWLFGDREEINFSIEWVSPELWEARRAQALTETAQANELRNVILWLARREAQSEELLPEIRRSEYLHDLIGEQNSDRDLAQYARSEQQRAERGRAQVKILLENALQAGLFIFRGKPTPTREASESLEAAAQAILKETAARIYDQYHLVKLNPPTNLAARFLEVERLDRMTQDRDPLKLVSRQGGVMRVDPRCPALAETLRAFNEKAGGGRLTGKALQDHFAAAPYGWSKDAVRYLFAALLAAGEVEFHLDGQALRTASPPAIDAVKNTLSFNPVGVSLRGSRPDINTLDRAARRLEDLFGESVLPLEDQIAQAARKHLALLLQTLGSLPDRLRLLNLPGEERARDLKTELAELLKGDASEAAPRLGAAQNTISQEIEWARQATRALDDQGENDIRQARAALNALRDMEQVYPGASSQVAPPAAIEQIQNALESQAFYEQLPDLRGGLRQVFHACQARYRADLQNYAAELESALAALESLPDWPRLLDADRQELAARLSLTLPPEAEAANPLSSYKILLALRRGLPALASDLKAEVARRAPPPVPEDNVLEIAFSELAPEDLIGSAEELEAWLEWLEDYLNPHIQAHKQIRITHHGG